MNDISFYLQKYANLGLKESKTKEFLQEAIREVCNVEVSAEDIEVSTKTIKINVSGAPKAEIHVNKNKVWQAFERKLGEGGYKAVDKKKIF